jgi:hypothetical protein
VPDRVRDVSAFYARYLRDLAQHRQ